MNKKELQLILDEGEGYFIEFKESLSKIDKEIVSFANSSGGRIFLGINDSSVIKGFKLDNRAKSEIQDIAENCDPSIRISIEKFENIVVINVPEGNRKPYKCSSGFYLRSGANSQKMSTDDIIAFIQNEGRVKFDEIFDKRFDFEKDFDNSKYQSFIRKCKISAEYDYKDVLQNLGLLTVDDNKPLLNNTGILFFATNPTRIFLHSVVTGVLYKGKEKINILDRKDFSGDLISNIEESITFLKKHLNISYKIESLQREDILEIPETALREAIVNSVVHRDYFEKGANIIIEIYDDRVEISNPGGLAKGLKEADFGTKSVARNPLIASMMLRANYIEKLGTGIKRIQDAMADAGLPEATFDIGNFFTVRFQRIHHDIELEAINRKKTYAIFGEQFAEKFALKFNIREKRLARILIILDLINKNENVSGEQFAEKFALSDRMIDKDLAFLKKIGLIVYEGSKKSGNYRVTDKFSENLEVWSNKNLK
jgi:ATP-dependent DNA helicase RecG